MRSMQWSWHTGNESHSKELAILDEAGALRHSIVERACARVGLLRQPIDPARAGSARSLLHRTDQGTPKTEIPRLLVDEQILEIAVVGDRPARAVEQVVRNSTQLAAQICAEDPHWFCRVVQACPDHVRGLGRNHHPVENLIAPPQRFPLRAFIGGNRTDRNLGGGHTDRNELLGCGASKASAGAFYSRALPGSLLVVRV